MLEGWRQGDLDEDQWSGGFHLAEQPDCLTFASATDLLESSIGEDAERHTHPAFHWLGPRQNGFGPRSEIRRRTQDRTATRVGCPGSHQPPEGKLTQFWLLTKRRRDGGGRGVPASEAVPGVARQGT